MSKIRFGIICPSEIAFRRFMPALEKCYNFEYVGVAVADETEWENADACNISGIIQSETKKAEQFKNTYGGEIFKSYNALLSSDSIDAVYLPLPPALHYKWGKKVLEHKKHLFLEKPSTTCAEDTKKLAELAKKEGLAVHENYMFMFHKQLDEIARILNEGTLGEVRLYNISFGFPRRSSSDFRYNKRLGGGAILDCGGYTVKLASHLLGKTSRVIYSKLGFTDEFDVDIYGSAAMTNDDGCVAHLSFGMDNSYKCSLEIWGSKGTLTTNRIFTAPVGFEPEAVLTVGNETMHIPLSADDTFYKSINKFEENIYSEEMRKATYMQMIEQAQKVDKIIELGSGSFDKR